MEFFWLHSGPLDFLGGFSRSLVVRTFSGFNKLAFSRLPSPLLIFSYYLLG